MSVTEANLQRCECCSLGAESSRVYSLVADPIRVCDTCERLLWAAETLWAGGAQDENEIITTLAFAASGAETPNPETSTSDYRRAELVRMENTVPVVRTIADEQRGHVRGVGLDNDGGGREGERLQCPYGTARGIRRREGAVA